MACQNINNTPNIGYKNSMFSFSHSFGGFQGLMVANDFFI